MAGDVDARHARIIALIMCGSNVIERLLQIEVSALCDADKGLPVVDPDIRAMVPDVRMAGPALTVVAQDDHLPVFSALDAAAPGDVLVVVNGGGSRAVVGELFATEARRRGLAGIVVDGLCRDVARAAAARAAVLRARDRPGFGLDRLARRAAPARPLRRRRRRAGDIVFGDDDGLVIAAPDRLAAALEGGEVIARAERAMLDGDGRGPPAARADQLRRARGGLDDGDARARWSSVSTLRELATILAGAPPGVLSLAGGFPNPRRSRPLRSPRSSRG